MGIHLLFFRRVKGSILNLVLGILLVMGGIIGALLLYAYYRDLLATRVLVQERLRHNARSGMELLLAPGAQPWEATELDLFGDGSDSVRLSRRSWGIFELAVSHSFSGKLSERLLALAGSEPDTTRQVALYLAEAGRPLYLAGDAVITGKVFLPEAGLKFTSLEHGALPTAEAVRGTVGRSKATLPPRFEGVFNSVQAYQDPASSRYTGAVPLVPALGGQQNFYSFAAECHLLFGEGEIRLEEITLAGNVIVKSNRAVSIGRSAVLEDIIVVAPYIVVESGFSGSVQLIARDSIVVREKATFEYPSALCLYSPTGDGVVRIGGGGTVTGDIYVGARTHPFNLLVIGPGAVVEGQVVVEGAVEHYGALSGTLICHNLLLRTPFELYRNYLKDATIDVTGLSSYYLTSAHTGSKAKKGVVKWVQ